MIPALVPFRSRALSRLGTSPLQSARLSTLVYSSPMKIRYLDTFYWVASLGSFRAAADKLNLTQPAVSARIQVLEQDLGAEVFVRDVNKTKLTPDGRKLMGFTECLMRLEQDVLSAFLDTTDAKQTIRLGASETIIATWLPDFIVRLRQSHAKLSFDLQVDSTDNLRDALVSREIDLAFLMGPVAAATVVNHDICTYEMIFAARPDLAALKDEWKLADIAGQPVLTFAANTKPSKQLRELLAPYSNGSPNMTTSTSMGVIIRLAKSGMGICAVPRAVIETELQTGELTVLETDVRLPAISFTASYVSGCPGSDLLASISEDAVEYLRSKKIKKHGISLQS
ncbi:MAG: LysR family transcriptional regulator [Nitrospinae bacterium]|nr:LysR family transcriptional regulator [Nitrospinota bacterium]